jgi:hypothetical protein
MKYLDEFRDSAIAHRLLDEIRRTTTRPWHIMEVCGGQTHSLIRNGIDQLLPESVELIHGPGCPVCVTPLEVINKALAIAAQPNVIFCSFGDMLRVPGSEAGVSLATGDTKVVDKGHGDGVYINTSGIGVVQDGVEIGPTCARPGDVVIVSGEIGVYGMAVMSVREGLQFDALIQSDTAPLNGLVADMLVVSHDIHVLRDPTRGGLASTLNEIAKASQVGIVIEEAKLPVTTPVRAACEMLGMDPIYVANEGKLVAIVPPNLAELMVARMQAHALGQQAAIIGRITDQHAGWWRRVRRWAQRGWCRCRLASRCRGFVKVGMRG